MNWSNVKLVFVRELRDQLRDRRTLFVIAVLPLMLYPLLGMSLMQVSQFLRARPSVIWIIGSESLPADPPLLDGERFAAACCPPEQARQFRLRLMAAPPPGGTDELERTLRRRIREGDCDAAVRFPRDFAARVERFRRAASGELAENAGGGDEPPRPVVYFARSEDRSRLAYARLEAVLRRWRDALVEANLRAGRMPLAAAQPFRLADADVSGEAARRSALWARVLPFVLLIWALTGAFYPAVDLCAGEKERGTLETLLTAASRRSEIVLGKLATVTLFSMATAVSNLASMAVTGAVVLRQLGAAEDAAVGPPPLAAALSLLIVLPLISLLFSALSLAAAAMARSTKEGQYYLMPLLLAALPLMLPTLLPAADSNWGVSLIPLAGVMLLLQALVESRYADAALLAGPALAVTLGCCALAVRWAVDQFNSEAVVFREGERWGVRSWARHLFQQRGETASFGQAAACGLLLLLISFFAGLAAAPGHSWRGLAAAVLATQLAFIATPALLMALVLTRSPRAALRLRWPGWSALGGAVVLACVLHPVAGAAGQAIQTLYPLSDEALARLGPYLDALRHAPLPYVLLVVAAAPAVCEELAFRGFILTGFLRGARPGTAVALSSLLFGVAHGLLQQSLSAFLLGLVLGYLAVQSRSVLPGMAFHFVHNSLSAIISRVTPDVLDSHVWLRGVFQSPGGGLAGAGVYQWPLTAAAAVVGAWLLLRWRAQPSCVAPQVSSPRGKTPSAQYA